MRKRRTAATAVLALAAITGPAALLMFAAGSASAAQNRPAAQPAAVAKVQEHLAIISKAATATKAPVRARGVLTAKGTAYAGKRSGDRANTWLAFKKGSVRLVTFRASSSASVPNPATCKFTDVFRGTYQLRGGTRRYASATGAGQYVTKIFARLKRQHGTCTSRLSAFWQGTWAWGSMHW